MTRKLLRMTPEEAPKLAEAVRAACLKAAKEGYEQASASASATQGPWKPLWVR